MAQWYASSGSQEKSEVYIQVFHENTDAAASRKDEVLSALRRPSLTHVTASSSRADSTTLAGLRAKTRQNADVWVALSDTPVDADAAEVLLVPISSDEGSPEWLAEFARQLEIRNIPTAEDGYRNLKSRGTACVLLHAIPWLAPNMPSSTIPNSDISQTTGSTEAQAHAAQAALSEYNQLMQTLATDGRDLPADARDSILGHFRQRLADLWGCTDDVIPRDLSTLLDDDVTRQFVKSALCVERLASAYFDPETFDFALIGSGLWRAFERTLNLSVVATLRGKAGIVTADPLLATGPKAHSGPDIVARCGPDSRDPGRDPQFVALRRARKDGALDGLSLGTIKDILEWAHAPLPSTTSKVFVPVQDTLLECLVHAADEDSWSTYLLGDKSGAAPCKGELSEAIAYVKNLRNPPSHIHRMDKGEYNKLRRIVLDDGHLGKVLQLVRILSVPVTVAP